jgi:hypothetical protein
MGHRPRPPPPFGGLSGGRQEAGPHGPAMGHHNAIRATMGNIRTTLAQARNWRLGNLGLATPANPPPILTHLLRHLHTFYRPLLYCRVDCRTPACSGALHPLKKNPGLMLNALRPTISCARRGIVRLRPAGNRQSNANKSRNLVEGISLPCVQNFRR